MRWAWGLVGPVDDGLSLTGRRNRRRLTVRDTTQWKVITVIATGGSYAPADGVGSSLVNLDSSDGDPI